MRDPIEVQRELDAAQADLAVKVGELKHVITDKLEVPKRIIHATEKPIAFIRAHAVVIAAVAAGLGLVWLAVRARPLDRAASLASRRL
jgi:hypothetical protein